MRTQVWSLVSFSRLRVQHCWELWYRSQMWLWSRVSVAVAWADGGSSDLTPSQGISICHWCNHKIYIYIYMCVCVYIYVYIYIFLIGLCFSLEDRIPLNTWITSFREGLLKLIVNSVIFPTSNKECRKESSHFLHHFGFWLHRMTLALRGLVLHRSLLSQFWQTFCFQLFKCGLDFEDHHERPV